MPTETVSRAYHLFTSDKAGSKLVKGSWNHFAFQQRQASLSSQLKLTPEQLQESIVAQLNYQVKTVMQTNQQSADNKNEKELPLDGIDEAMRSQLLHKRELITSREKEKKKLAKEFGIDVCDVNEMIKHHEASERDKKLSELAQKKAAQSGISQEEYKEALNLQKKIDQENELMAEAGCIQASNDSLEHSELIDDVIEDAYQAIRSKINDPRVFLVSPGVMHLMLPHKESGQAPNITQLLFQEAQKEMASIPAGTEIIICPINDKKSTRKTKTPDINGADHWTMIVIDKRDPQEIGFHFFDSLKNDKHISCARKIADHLFTLMNHSEADLPEKLFKAHKTPQQTSHESGIYVIETSRVIAERFKNKPKAAIQPIERKDILEPEQVRNNLKKIFDDKFSKVLQKIAQNSLPTQETNHANVISLSGILSNRKRYSALSEKIWEHTLSSAVGTTYKLTINELRGLSDEAILDRKDVVLAPAVKGMGIIVKQLSNGDVVIQMSPKRRLDSPDPLYLVKAARLKRNSKICLEKSASYEADPYARRHSEKLPEVREQTGEM